MMDDEGLRDDIPIGVRAHRGIILKKIDALRAAAAKLNAAGVQFSLVPALGIVMVRKDFAKEGRAIVEEALLEQKKGSSRQPAVLRQLRCVSHVE